MEDLIQEVSLAFLELDDNKKKKVSSYFQFWVVRVVTNQWKSTTSPFYSTYRNSYYIEDSPSLQIEDPQESDFNLGQEEMINSLISELYISDQNVIRDYYEKGMTIMEITEKYQVEKTFVWNVLDRVRKSFKRRIEWQNEKPNTIYFIELIAPYIGRSRLKIGERQIIVDVYNHVMTHKVNATHSKMAVNSYLEGLIKRLQL